MTSTISAPSPTSQVGSSPAKIRTSSGATQNLPPIVTSPLNSAPTPPRLATSAPHSMSHASRARLSQYSAASSAPSRSRPTSQFQVTFTSSLSYALVRDFAYPQSNPLHYGPPPEPSRPPSEMTTPATDYDPLFTEACSQDENSSSGLQEPHRWSPEPYDQGPELAPVSYGDGPPWSEDEDLQSPVVSSRHEARHKKNKSTSHCAGQQHLQRDQRGECSWSGPGGADMASSNLHHGREPTQKGECSGGRYYVSGQDCEANGPGGEYVTYAPGQGGVGDSSAHQHSNAHNPAVNRLSDSSCGLSSPSCPDNNESRYSRDYQFTITSPDEAMHGKAVALFDFEREHENELPLVEGQIIWVSYRQSLGWLVAQDPKTCESGLVPEEYVRLLRDPQGQGGVSSLPAMVDESGPGPADEVAAPTSSEQRGSVSHVPASNHSSNGYHHPVVSTFSTSSKDLERYPHHMLGGQQGQTPPHVVHYHSHRAGSQANTPTRTSDQEAALLRRASTEAALSCDKGKRDWASSMPNDELEMLPNSKLDRNGSEPPARESFNGGGRRWEER